MSNKKRRPGSKPAPRPPARRPPPALLAGLQEADSLMGRQRWSEAGSLLETLNQRYPGREELLELWLEVSQQLRDTRRCQGLCEQLLRSQPNDPDLLLILAGAYLANAHPVLGLRTFQRFLERWPEHERAAEARTAMEGVEGHLGPMLAELGLGGDEGIELAGLHEEMQALLAQGQYAEARRAGRRLLARLPHFAPALNNISQTYYAEGHLEQAMATVREVLDFAPDNVHALSNLTRLACLSGRMDEARQFAEQLQASAAPGFDRDYKIAEALSYLGDDAGVLEAFQRAGETGRLESSDPTFYHLAAVAALRLGREEEARRHWKRALELAPGLALARENLQDLARPPAERNGPWPFPFQNWITAKATGDLASLQEPAKRGASERALAEAVRTYVRRHPEVSALIPLLLDRGDPMGRQFALLVARLAATPALTAALRDFAFSQRGPDSQRMEAAQAALSGGLLAPGPTRLWMRGEWQELILMGYELHDEPLVSHPPQVEAWITEALDLMRRGAADRAESLFLRAREAEPDAPDILNNLAGVYSQQGRTVEAEALMRQAHERHPDYTFAATNLASICARTGRIEEARALLEPVLTRPRLHFNEFASLCMAQIELSLAENNQEAARSWLEMWEGADADHPHLEQFRRRINGLGPRKPPWKPLPR
ncbi:MAG: tetratricopeptide repeat protein [Armatimonadetes bacterium]|nr:tetratricopeptide repeat protein [Armatimonadota bacterium]